MTLLIITVIFLTLLGILYIGWGSNVQSRMLGLMCMALAVANGLKLDGLI